MNRSWILPIGTRMFSVEFRWLREFRNLVVIKSISKTYGVRTAPGISLRRSGLLAGVRRTCRLNINSWRNIFSIFPRS